MGHLETAVRTLAMLARGNGCCTTFEERLDVLMQAYYFVGRMAGMVEETVECGHRRRLFEESVPEGGERGETAFQEWCASSSGGPRSLYCRVRNRVHHLPCVLRLCPLQATRVACLGGNYTGYVKCRAESPCTLSV